MLVLLLAAATLLAVRVPSLAQPMGADQGLYAYIGERILHGERPYVDAWDQKPPAIHYTYALLRALWPADGVVAAADLIAAALLAAVLVLLGTRLQAPQVGTASALLFLLLSNPAFGRLAGVRVRAQAETFIALAVAGGVYLLVLYGSGFRVQGSGFRGSGFRGSGFRGSGFTVQGSRFGVLGSRFAISPLAVLGGAGLLFGIAFTYKYNAAVYALAALAGLLCARRLTLSGAAAFLAGCAAPSIVFLAVFADALVPLYDATISYNVGYSGETYRGPLHFIAYLLTFPVAHARNDALWTLGGAGCLVLLATAVRAPSRLLPVVWVAAGCISVAINSSRGLPQYFVQVAPPLALAAAWGGWVAATAILGAWPRRRAAVALMVALLGVTIAVWRVNQFPKLLEQTWFDARHLAGRVPREAYLARYVDGQKYTALGAAQVAEVMRLHSSPGAAVYLFGFTAAAYVHADRQSASRFFWSRPVIAGFKDGIPGYGPAGLLADLERARPAVVALQLHDWAPDVDNSASFFLSNPSLSAWLQTGYRRLPGPEGFDVWISGK